MLTHVQVIEELIFLLRCKRIRSSSLGNVKLAAPRKISKTFQCSNYILRAWHFSHMEKGCIVLMFVMKM